MSVLLNLVGSILFSSLFLMSGIYGWIEWEMLAGLTTSKLSAFGVPENFGPFLYGAALGMKIIGPLFVIVGVFSPMLRKLGALLVASFLIPVTFVMHNFWDVTDSQAQQTELLNFVRNVSLLGACFIIFATSCHTAPANNNNNNKNNRKTKRH